MPDLDMLINHLHGEESRIAIVAEGKLEELYTERVSADLHVGNIYRGRVTNIEPAIQAAFVDFGEARSGFLHITDLHPRYFPGEDRETTEKVGEKTPRRERPPIQRCLRRGQEILVQVLKEGIGTKGPTLTSYLSIPGRYLVMMPNMERHGVSRKVDDPEKRREMRKILDELNPPSEFGFIVRTAGLGRPKTELKRDLNYLLRLWKNIEAKMKTGRGPALLYTESDLVIRTLRDVMTSDVKRIVVDDRAAALRAKEFLRIATPRSSVKVIYYGDTIPLFDAFDVERQIQVISQRIVPMPNGGSLVFDQAEAMVAIDVNSGKFRDNTDAEETAYRTNLDAVDEIARQLRLRDLGGLIVLDLIDMYVHRHRRDVERRFRDALKKDRARTKVLKISDLGLLEMTRQRMRPSLRKSVYNECPSCHGTGHVLSPQSVVLEVMRRLAVAANAEKIARIALTVHSSVLTTLLNRKRTSLTQIEESTGKKIEFHVNDAVGPDQIELLCFDDKDTPVDLEKLPRIKQPKFSREQEIRVDDLAELEELLQPEEEEQETETKPESKAESAEADDKAEESTGGKRKRRRRRRRRGRGGSSDTEKSDAAEADEPSVPSQSAADAVEAAEESAQIVEQQIEPAAADTTKPEPASEAEKTEDEKAADDAGDEDESKAEGEPKRRRRRRGGRRHRRRRNGNDGESGESGENGSEKPTREDNTPSEQPAPVSRGYERG